MSDCGCSKNQTHQNIFEALRKQGKRLAADKLLGFGIFLVPAPENGILEYRIVSSKEPISYRECAKRGENCKAFKWFPQDIPLEFEEGTTVVFKDLAEFEQWRAKYNCEDYGCCIGCRECPPVCLCEGSYCAS